MTDGRRGHLLSKIWKLLLCVLIGFVILVPLYWMIATSFKPETAVYSMPLELYPKNPTLENYQYALTQTKIPLYFLNSVIYVIATVVVVVMISSLAAFSLSRFKHRGKRAFLWGVLVTQYMPLTTLIVPLYIMFSKFNLMNNRLAMIAIYAAIQIPIAIWLLIGYFNGISRSLDEAARIDGCTTLQAFFKVILPLAKPGLMAVSISCAISIWQELLLATTFTTSDKLRPLMVGVSASVGKAGVKWSQLTAVGVIACVPILIIYGFCQKYLVRGLTNGAVKE